MSMSKKQQVFSVCVAKLIMFAHEQGYGLTFGDAFRDKRVHGAFGEKKSYAAAYSIHKRRLAVDLNLFVDGQYITDGNCPEYVTLGEYWESLHSSARWGGRFNDANHFSFEHDGVK